MKIHERILRTIDGLLTKVLGIRSEYKRLAVPFVSQLGHYANKKHNDCGAACVAMIIRAFFPDDKTTVDHLYYMTGVSGDNYLSVWNLINLLKAFKIKSERVVGKKIEDFIDAKKGVIALIKYSEIQKWELNPNSYFGGQHFVVVIGYNDKHYFVHDPLYPAGFRYRFRKIPKDVFDNSWRSAEPIRLAVVTVGEIK